MPLAPSARRTRNFALAPDCTHEHQSRKVEAGDQQDDGDGEEECLQQRTGLLDRVLLKRAHQGIDVQVRHIGGVSRHDFFRNSIGVTLSLSGRNAWLEARNNLIAPVGRARRESSSGRKLIGTQSSERFSCPGTRGNSKPRGITPMTM